MQQLSPEALSEQLQANDSGPLVLDIRHREDFEAWHSPGSRNVDVYDALVEDPEQATHALEELPDDEQIVTICAAGVVSQTATAVLQQLGYDAVTLTDGMNGWSRVHRHAEVPLDIDGTFLQVARPGKGCVSHILVSDGDAAVFDTHAHTDHIPGAADLADHHSAPYYLHPKDAIALEATPLEDGQLVTVGGVDIEVIHTPGHSEGSVTFDVAGGALLTGDTLFYESVGRVELGVEAGIEDSDVAGNAATLYENLQRLLERPDDALVLPAHDPGSSEPPVTATLGAVKEQNEDLGRGREPFVAALASDMPDLSPNFERVKRANVAQEPVSATGLAELELGPNNCAAE